MKYIALCLSLLLFPTFTCSATAGPLVDAMGTISGQMLQPDNIPFSNGVVSFFPVDKGLPIDNGIVRRIPDHVVRIGKDGSFNAKLPAGQYYVGALQREWGKGPGPPRPGETFCFVLDSERALQIFNVLAGQVVNAGPLSGGIPDISLKADVFFTVQGKVIHKDGRPFPGALVTAKENLNDLRPSFISELSKADGSYSLSLPAGKYYIIALESIQGGRPDLGSYLGGYGGDSPAREPEKDSVYPPIDSGRREGYFDGLAVSGKAGELIKEINITMYEMPDPAAIRNERRNQAITQPTP